MIVSSILQSYNIFKKKYLMNTLKLIKTHIKTKYYQNNINH